MPIPMLHFKYSLRQLIATAFFLSGVAALSYQIAWQRVLTQVIGSDAISITFIVTIFMLWLGLGAELARRLIGSGLNRHALRIYAVIEFVVGLYGAASLYILRAGNAWLATQGPTDVQTDLLFNAGLLAVPIIGMGMTTPLIIHLVKHTLADLGQTAGRFYGLNILGAAAGAFLAGFFLIELAGLWGTVLIAAAINLGIGVCFLVGSRRWPAAAPEEKTISLPAPKRLYLSAVLFGFVTLAVQILFMRMLINYFTMTVMAFPVILGTYLLLMAGGQYVGGRFADGFPALLGQVIVSLYAIGAVLLALALLFPPNAAIVFGALRFTTFNGSLLQGIYGMLVGGGYAPLLAAFAAFIMLAVIPWAALFPVMLRLATRDISTAGARFASLYFSYTIGNVIGTLVCGLYLLEQFGTAHTAQIIIVVAGLATLLLVPPTGSERRRIYGAYGLAALAVLAIPSSYYSRFHLGDYHVSDVYEGRNGVVTVVPTKRFYTIVDMNRTACASAMKNDPGPADQYEAWRWNHTELLALDPDFRPRDILVIGLGHAYLIDALLDLPSVEKIVVVELSQEVVDAVKAETRTSTKRIFTDPRVDIVVADGRRYVQKALAEGKRFDLIQTKINEPWHAGSGNLFTREFFASQRALLNPAGYLGTRPLLGHLSDGLSVFGTAIWPGYYHLFFPRDPKPMPTRAVVTPDIAMAWKRILPAGAIGSRVPELDIAYFDALPEKWHTAPNTDNRPNFEYSWLHDWFSSRLSPRTGLDTLDLGEYRHTVPVITRPGSR